VFGYSARQTFENAGCVIKQLLYITEQPLVLEFKSVVPVCNCSRKECILLWNDQAYQEFYRDEYPTTAYSILTDIPFMIVYSPS
jgi:hypothetical protein